MMRRDWLRNSGAAVVAALGALAWGCEGEPERSSPKVEDAHRPGLSHDLVEAAGGASLNEVDLELMYNLLERGALAISVEERLAVGSCLEYRAPTQRSAWLEQLVQCFELAPLPHTYARGELAWTSDDLLFERTGVGGVSWFGAVHDYDSKTERLSLWGIERTEHGPGQVAVARSHVHDAAVAPSNVATTAPRLLNTRLGYGKGSEPTRTVRDELLRLRVTSAAVLGLLQKAPAAARFADPTTESWATAQVVRKVGTRSVTLTQRVRIADDTLIVSQESAAPASSERYEVPLETVSLVSDVYESIQPREWRFHLAGGSGRTREGSGWRLTLSGVDHEAPFESVVPSLPLTFASKAEAVEAREWFLGKQAHFPFTGPFDPTRRTR